MINNNLNKIKKNSNKIRKKNNIIIIGIYLKNSGVQKDLII